MRKSALIFQCNFNKRFIIYYYYRSAGPANEIGDFLQANRSGIMNADDNNNNNKNQKKIKLNIVKKNYTDNREC